MNRIIILGVLIVNALGAIAQNAFESRPSWRQEFNKSGTLDKRLWSAERATEKSTLQYYAGLDEKNVFVKRGKLNIVLRKDSMQGKAYTSARVISKDTFSCGKLVFRAKYPIASGTWTNIWLRSFKNKSLHGEIDIAEYTSKWGKDKYQFNLHTTGEYNGNEKYHKQYKKYIKIDVSKWHVYTLEWFPDSMIVYIDGAKMAEQHREDLEVWPFNDNPYKLYMNIHYGGMGGEPDDTKLPQTLLVDWIRYYPLKK